MIGALNPCAFKVGGGPTLAEKLYRESRLSLGEGGAGEVNSLEDKWRQAKALARAKGLAAVERAASQAFPHLGVEQLPVYEDMLSLEGAGEAADRSEAVARALSDDPAATVPNLLDELRRIDPIIELDTIDATESVVARYGKPFQVDGSAQQSSRWPAFSQHFFAHVRWPVPGGIPPSDDRAEVVRSLNRMLPAWCDFVIYNKVGFFFDGFNDSFLDITALEP